MNHVAHCFLSFGNEDLLIGNFIGDFIKGNTWKAYQEGVQQGILLHRFIDDYTDRHPASDRSVERIRQFARRYSAPVTDVLYDHLLILHWEQYSSQSYEHFTQETYSMLHRRVAEMPETLQERFPRMVAADFLNGYSSQEGMRFVMERFSKRLHIELDVSAMMDHFFKEIDYFSQDFRQFFPDLVQHAQQQVSSNTRIE